MPQSAAEPPQPSPGGPASGPPSREDPGPEVPGARRPDVSGPGARVPEADRPAGHGGGGRWWIRPLPVLFLLALLTRLPSFTRPLWNPDEGFLATQAGMLADGGTLYDTVVDRKPPLLPWLYEAAFALTGDASLWPLRIAAVAAVAVGAALLASLVRRRWGGRTGWTAGVLYVLLSVGLSPEDTQAASFAVFMVPWTIAAMWCADRRRWTGAGLCVAGALLTKQTGGAVLLPVLFLLWRARRRPDGPPAPAAGGPGRWAAARLAAGTVLPVAAVALAFGPGRFAYWMATGSGAYASVRGAALYALGRAAGNAGLLALACLPSLVALGAVARARGRRPAALSGSADIGVWLAASALAATVGFQFFGHYFLQLTPPLAVFGAVALRSVRPRAASAAVALTALIAGAFVCWGLVAGRAELDHAERVAAAVRARTEPGDPVLLWGMHPEGYWLSGRPPASRYLTAGFLTNFSGGRGGVRVGERYAMDGAWPYFRRELRERPPALVVDDSRGAPYGVARTPTLRRWLERHYERAGSVDGAVLWVPAAGPGAPPATAGAR